MFPIHIEIETTNRCNLSCIMCPHRLMKRKQEDMKMEVFEKIAKECDGKVKTSYLHMIGEPLLHKDIVHMIKTIHFAGIKTSISTNCMLLEDDLMKDIISFSYLDELVMCLDGTDKNTYSKFRVGGDFDRVVYNINECIKYRRSASNSPTQLILQLINMQDNIEQQKDIFKKYQAKLDEVGGRIWIKDFSTFAGAIDDLGNIKTKPRRFKCNKLNTHIAFHSNGDCVICCRDYDGITKIGNILDASISDLWLSAEYNKYRIDHVSKRYENPMCKNC